MSSSFPFILTCYQLQSIYAVVTYLKNHSGLTWSETHGASITAADETVWADIIKKHPAASPFCNHSWALYDLVSALKPPQSPIPIDDESDSQVSL